jgi:hypothetical protein
MSDAFHPQIDSEEMENKAVQIASHLRREPHDLIDTKRLMHRFRASAEDFQRAFLLLEQPVRN